VAINRIIHQLWIGDRPMPEREAAWCLAMRRMNQNWDYRLWGNVLLEKFASDPYVKALQDRGEPLAFLADRLRILLLAEFGGLYVDCDAQPLKPFDSIDVWDDPRAGFVYGVRDPYRPDVALHRGVACVDNTILASEPNGKMVKRLLDCWRPNDIVITGHRVGLTILRHADASCRGLGFEYFYAMSAQPNSIILHDCHNAGTWVKDARKPIPVGDQHIIANGPLPQPK
jgi:hypothetical protein